MNYSITYTKESSQRLDTFLVGAARSDHTRSYWNNMIEHGYVLVNDAVTKSGRKLSDGDIVTVQEQEIHDEHSKLVTVLFEDSANLVINKPAGMLVHSKGAFNPEYTVADYALDAGIEVGRDASSRNGIVHRLDRHTSGVMIIAKTVLQQTFLQKQFADRSTKKTYIAVVEGVLADDSFTIDIPIARNPKKPKTFHASEDGKEAQTRVQVISRTETTTLVLLTPITGRTHQLRVHLTYINHPICGDVSYGAAPLGTKRFLLHAYALQLETSAGKRQEFIAEIPEDMTRYIHDADQDRITAFKG